MRPRIRLSARVVVACALLAAGCAASEPSPGEGSGPRVVRPGAPGEPTRVDDGVRRDVSVTPTHSEGDARFMRNMIVHHAQALVMSGLAEGRSDRGTILLLARRIERSQTDEIVRMQQWLASRGEPVPDPPEAYEAWRERRPDTSMAGMVSPADLESLASADGPRFDRIFLILMIRHHQGALDMIDELLSDSGSAQGGEIFQLASDAASDQRIEIARMVELLRDLEPR